MQLRSGFEKISNGRAHINTPLHETNFRRRSGERYLDYSPDRNEERKWVIKIDDEIKVHGMGRQRDVEKFKDPEKRRW